VKRRHSGRLALSLMRSCIERYWKRPTWRLTLTKLGCACWRDERQWHARWHRPHNAPSSMCGATSTLGSLPCFCSFERSARTSSVNPKQDTKARKRTVSAVVRSKRLRLIVRRGAGWGRAVGSTANRWTPPRTVEMCLHIRACVRAFQLHGPRLLPLSACPKASSILASCCDSFCAGRRDYSKHPKSLCKNLAQLTWPPAASPASPKFLFKL
jgi:hypothetical protein